VCGRVVAYQIGASDAFSQALNIETNSIDGISVTHGAVDSRQHIWSFITAVGEIGSFQTTMI
jgi:hypothetical protein